MTDQDAKAMVLSTGHKQMLSSYAKNYMAVKAIEKEMKLEVDRLKEVMIQNNVTEIDNGEYVLKLSVVNGVKQVGEVASEFTKVVLDTAKTNAHVTLTGELPSGVERTTTYKLNAPKAKK